MATVFFRLDQENKKRYYIDYTQHGKRKKKCVGKSKRVADTIAKDIEVKIATAESGIFLTEITLEKFKEEYLPYCATVLKPRSIERTTEIINSFVSHFPKIKLNLINLRHIEQYRTIRSEKIKNITSNVEMTIISKMFNTAIKWNYLKENPIKQIEKLPVIKNKLPRFFSKDEVDLIVKNSLEPFRDIFLTLVYTGLRRNELLFLRCIDVDLARDRMHIKQHKHFTPKTSFERTIPIHKELKPILQNYIKPNGYLFANEKGKVYNRNTWRQMLLRICNRLNIKNVTLHTTRHTTASWLVMQGIGIEKVKELLGHSNISTTLIYAHLSPSHLEDCINALPFGNSEGTFGKSKI